MMGSLLSILTNLRYWVSSTLFVIKFRGMRLMQYCGLATLTLQPTSVDDIEMLAKRYLLKDVYEFVSSGSANQCTLKENRIAYTRYQIRPRFVRDTSHFDMRVTLLGEDINFPICVAPTGCQRFLHWEGEVATAKVEMEDVAEANGNGVRWFHLMLTLPDDLLKEHIIQAEKAGFKAFVITVDQSNVSVPRANMQIFGMKLATFPLFKIPPNEPVIKHICTNCFSAITWERIEWIQTLTALPIIIKGILTAEDAIEAVEHNVSAIIVSNHGGRLLDCVPASIDALEEIANAVGDKIEVYLDGGIRHGTDIFKALARGAKAVFIGRPVLWGLAYKGSKGVEQVLSILKNELEVTMRLAGCSQLGDIKKEMVAHSSYYHSKI